ncbi:vitamin K epoxide reductase family protein [Kribbella speibonae]|uniref:Vitamin K epoxide reductase family protein n=2 Tax=Kribbella speibonae TaxID=1572660 RepID=A0A4R0IUZ3_9ACTN|nr:vitamin K epoxide reductase family protein [Kribbella speibonae]
MLASTAGLIASLVLSVDAYRLAQDPQTGPSCNINAVLSCGSVGSSEQAHVFGFPNAFLGLITEPVVLTIAVCGLAGVRFPRWLLACAQGACTVGLGFSYWMLFESVFAIKALCPWCLLVTLTTTLVFAAITVLNVRNRTLPLPAGVQALAEQALSLDADAFALAAWILAVATVIVSRFGSALLQ